MQMNASISSLIIPSDLFQDDNVLSDFLFRSANTIPLFEIFRRRFTDWFLIVLSNVQVKFMLRAIEAFVRNSLQ